MPYLNDTQLVKKYGDPYKTLADGGHDVFVHNPEDGDVDYSEEV